VCGKIGGITPTSAGSAADPLHVLVGFCLPARKGHIEENIMILDKEKQKEFEIAAEPLIKFLCDNCHPHVSVIVDCCSAELSEGICSVRNDKFIKD
jgi:hypothetical protein